MADDASVPAGSVLSPCVRNCCLDDNDICMGCYRSISEIVGWNEAADDQKREILARCRLRRKQRDDKMQDSGTP